MRMLRAVLLLTLIVLAYPAWLAFQVWAQSHKDEPHSADAIVVLGAAQYDGRPSPVFKARLDHAAYLYDEELSSKVIVTGGKRPGDRFTEAEAGQNYLQEQGVATEDIEEVEGSTTFESLEGVRDIADEQEIRQHNRATVATYMP